MKHSFISSKISKILVLYGTILKLPFVTITYIFFTFAAALSFGDNNLHLPFVTLSSEYVEPFIDTSFSLDAAGSSAFVNCVESFSGQSFDRALLLLDSSRLLLPEMEDYSLLLYIRLMVAQKKAVEGDSLLTQISRLKHKSPAASAVAVVLMENTVPASDELRLGIVNRLIRDSKNPRALYLAALLADSLKKSELVTQYRTALLELRKVNEYSDSTATNFHKNRQRLDIKLLTNLAAFFEWRMNWRELHTLATEAYKRSNLSKSERSMFLSYAHTAAYRQRDYVEALRLIRLLEKEGGRTPETLFKYALNLEKMQYWRASWLLYREYLRRWSTGVHGDNFLWDLARRLERKQRFDRAAVVFLNIEKNYPKEYYSSHSRFRAAFCKYKAGLFKETVSLLSTFPSRYPSARDLEASIYWTGRSYEALTMADSASYYYKKLLMEYPLSYYAMLGEKRLPLSGGDGMADYSGAITLDSFINHIDAAMTIDTEDPLPIKRGLLLMRAGLDSLAVEELSAAGNWAKKKVSRLYRLSRIYEAIGKYSLAQRTAMEIYYRTPLALKSKIPIEIKKLFFPRYYGEAVDMEARRIGIDPFLVHAIMRQESQFDHKALSRAGAVGLLQLMPMTGLETARKLSIEFHVDSLQHPFYNIRLGAYHLSELLDRFDGKFEWIMAAYNAGSTVTMRWKKETEGVEYDVMVEEIAYGETRDYVKKCMRNYRFYKNLWN